VSDWDWKSVGVFLRQASCWHSLATQAAAKERKIRCRRIADKTANDGPSRLDMAQH